MIKKQQLPKFKEILSRIINISQKFQEKEAKNEVNIKANQITTTQKIKENLYQVLNEFVQKFNNNLLKPDQEWIREICIQEHQNQMKSNFQNQIYKINLDQTIQSIIKLRNASGKLQQKKDKGLNQKAQIKSQKKNIIWGYKLLSFKPQGVKQGKNKKIIEYQSNEKSNKKILQQSHCLFNHPLCVQLNENQQKNIKMARISNELILEGTSNIQQFGFEFFSDFYQQQANTNLIQINPNIEEFSRNIQSFVNSLDKLDPESLANLLIQTPRLLILNNNRIQSLLSVLAYQLIFNQVEQTLLPDVANFTFKKMKILLTEQIYLKYLELFGFIQMLTKQWRGLQNKIKLLQNNISQLQNKEIINFQDEAIDGFEKKVREYEFSKEKIDEKLRQCFYFSWPNEQVNFLALNICFKSPNIYFYNSYDLKISVSELDQSSKGEQEISQLGTVIIEDEYLKNVQKIYHSYKNNQITEKQYIQIIQRMEQKEEKQKKQYNYQKNHLKAKHIQIIHQTKQQQKSNQVKNSIDFLNIVQSLIGLQRNSKIFNFFNNMKAKVQSKVKITRNFSISQPKLIQSALCHNPHQISHKKRELFFSQLRSILAFSALSDFEIVQILDNGILIEYLNSQIVRKSCSKLEEVFILLKGKAQLIDSKNQNEARQILKRSNLFGWSYFVACFDPNLKQDVFKKNITPTLSQLKMENKFSTLSLHSYTPQDPFNNCQKENYFTMKIISAKALVLKIPFYWLDFLLYDKRALLKQHIFNKQF